MTTLALNIIVAPGEAGLLKRCLDSFNAKESFDEIVVVNTSLDEAVDKTAREYTDKVFFFQWETEEYPFGDFAGARNLALENSTTDNIMWLDTDDILLPIYDTKWTEFLQLVKKDENASIEQWAIQYALICNPDGSPVMSFWRERIFKRTVTEWRRPVHECLVPEWDAVKNAKVNNLFITHLPMKPVYVSAVRNVKILEKEYANNPDDIQTKFFLARDRIRIGQTEEGIKALEEMVDNLEAGSEMLLSICLEIVLYYAYGECSTNPLLEDMNQGNLDKVEKWCRQALSFTAGYAEPYLILGDVYWFKGLLENAMQMYMTASKKKLGVGKFQSIPYYTELPNDRLSRVFEARGNFAMSAHFNKLAIKYNPIDYYINRRKFIINELVKEYNNEFGKD